MIQRCFMRQKKIRMKARCGAAQQEGCSNVNVWGKMDAKEHLTLHICPVLCLIWDKSVSVFNKLPSVLMCLECSFAMCFLSDKRHIQDCHFRNKLPALVWSLNAVLALKSRALFSANFTNFLPSCCSCSPLHTWVLIFHCDWTWHRITAAV